MPNNDLNEDKYIEGQLEALDGERQAIEDKYNDGELSDKDYKTLLAKNDYLASQITERNQENVDRKRQKTHERKRDVFND